MMLLLSKLAREPLTWFLLLGGGLFFVANWQQQDTLHTIVVSDDRLVDFVRQQSRDFAPDSAARRVQQASEATLEDWVAQYVRDEALFREAQALGFAERDYVIRRRLIQRVEMLAQGVAATNVSMDEDAARTYYQDHREQYWQPARITFTHVFFAHTQDEGDGERAAHQALAELSNQPAAATGYGQRFLYHLNYVDRPRTFIASHFGASFAQQVFSLEVAARWQGPLESEHGWHLVQVRKLDPGRQPAFAEVEALVTIDARHSRIQAASERVIDEMLAKYRIDDQRGDRSGG